MGDPLADVIAKARRTKPQHWIEAPSTTDERIAAAVRAHLAAALDAEEARWENDGFAKGPVQYAIHCLRAALLGTDNETTR